MRFETVSFLLAIPFGATLTFALLWRSRSELPPRRRAFSLIVRTAIVSLLLAAMARPSYPRRVEGDPVTVFLLDVSGSLSDAGLKRAVEDVESISRELSREGKKSALVAFAGAAEVIRPPSGEPISVPRDLVASSEKERPAARREALLPNRTDFARALKTGEGLALSDARYVFVTDGRDSSGTLPAARPDVRLLRVPPDERDVAALGIRAPVSVRAGEPFDVRVDLWTARDAELEIFLMVDGVEAARRRRTAHAGRSVEVLRNVQPTLPHGPHRLVALVRSEGDSNPRNNLRGAPLFVLGRPRVLVAEETPGAGEAIVKTLQSHQFDVRRIPAARWGDENLGDFDAVVASEVRGTSISAVLAQRLKDYVENGGGLWWIPPADPAASAEISRSPIADLLPVEFDPAPLDGGGKKADRTERKGAAAGTEKNPSATVALLLLVDKSGSMAGDKIDMVKEACRETADTLDERDWIGVIGFDARPHWVLEFTHPLAKESIRDRIYRLLADGGTDIYPALQEAHRALLADPRAATAGIRHVILFSDGDTQPADIQGEVRKMTADGITVSTVCILQGRFDLFLMKEIADVGKGRFHYTRSFAGIPKIFTQEARTLIEAHRPSVKEDDRPAVPDIEPTPGDGPKEGASIQPMILEEHEILWPDMPRFIPSLRGMLPAKARSGARVPIGTEERRPLLAIQRVGLGKVAAWTSDLAGRWSADWLRWPATPKLFAHLVRHLSSASESLDLAGRVEVDVAHDRATLEIAAGDPAEQLTLVRIHPQPEAIPLSVSSDGGRRARIPLEDEPSFLLLRKEAAGRTENLSLILDRSYEEEYFPRDPATGDSPAGIRPWLWSPAPAATRPFSIAVWLILAALLLLPLDVALQRLR